MVGGKLMLKMNLLLFSAVNISNNLDLRLTSRGVSTALCKGWDQLYNPSQSAIMTDKVQLMWTTNPSIWADVQYLFTLIQTLPHDFSPLWVQFSDTLTPSQSTIAIDSLSQCTQTLLSRFQRKTQVSKYLKINVPPWIIQKYWRF